MKLVLQRVKEARVSVEGKQVGVIGAGLLVFLCIEKGDDEQLAEHYASKVVELRIFGDEQGKMNRSLREVGGEVLLISQFTLAADAEKGRRPSFDRAAPPETADRLYRHFAGKLQALGISVATGVFQAFMEVALINDGPVTILLGN
ncbi:MAG TPA: D-aminoacyl-tRNA deacylase [Acidobacteriota bacterium]|nr:D-aminoacyl-tRNA deacylase [Acidobacteriota bacterium]